MEMPIDIIQENIEYHRKSIRWLGIGIWVIVIFGLLAHVVITSMLEQEINRLAAVIHMAVQSGVSEAPKDPEKLAFAARDNNLGWLVLAMFFTSLFAMLGKMRFHLKEVSLNESRLHEIVLLKEASQEGIDPEIKKALINKGLSKFTGNDPTINLGPETVLKITDSIVEKLKNLSVKS